MSDIEELSKKYVDSYILVTERVKQYAQTIWGGAGLNHGQVEKELLEEILPRVKAGQVTVSQLTNAYMNACADVLGIPRPNLGIDYEQIDQGVRGVPPRDVYRRPAVRAYSELKNKQGYEQAKHYGGLRLIELIGMDLLLSRRQSANRNLLAMSDHGVQYYRRVLTGREHCALCIVASTQRYKIQRTLMPIHPGCDCGQEPLPPGLHSLVLDPETLEKAHEAVAGFGIRPDRSGRNPDYRHLIIRETSHGEYGQVMQLNKFAAEKRAKK